MKAVAFSPAAEADLSEIWDYTAHRLGAWPSRQLHRRNSRYLLCVGPRNEARPSFSAAGLSKIPVRFACSLFLRLCRPPGRYPCPAPKAGCRTALVGHKIQKRCRAWHEHRGASNVCSGGASLMRSGYRRSCSAGIRRSCAPGRAAQSSLPPATLTMSP